MNAQPANNEDDLGQTQESHLQVTREGRVAATAKVVTSPQPHGTAKVALDSPRDGVVPGARRDLVDQVLDHPGVSNSDDVHVVVTRGDAESITALQQRTTNFTAHPAGSSSIIDADLPPEPDQD